jgi:hypothetical protein
MHLLGACLFIGNIIVSGSWKAAAQKLIVLGAQMTADGPDCVKTSERSPIHRAQRLHGLRSDLEGCAVMWRP